jgi:penicillin-binding protein 1A
MLVRERDETRVEHRAAPPPTAPAPRRRRPLGVLAGAWLLVVLVGALSLAMIVAGLAVGPRLVGAVVGTHPKPLVLPPLDQRTVVYAADNSVAAILHADEDRVAVPLDQVSPVLVAAVIDTEDVRFWQHGPVDVRAILRAFNANTSAGGEIRQGGSTIAQQLAKITLLSSKQDLSRKVKEVVLANQLIDQLGKRGVLERYLNTVYFGEGAYGVQAAAQHYFGATAATVTPAQAALLAGIIHDPEGTSPFRQAPTALARRATVLDLMVKHGDLPADQAAAAAKEPLPKAPVDLPAVSDYFTDAVKQELLADPRLGKTPQERFHAVFAGGLTVHTTLDPAAQQAARDAVRDGLPDAPMPLTAAVVSIDPSNGEVRAIVGGPNYVTSAYNPAVDGVGRQPGSSFKPFTLIAALEQGYSPNDTIDGSSPCTIPNPGGVPDPWMPENFEGEAVGITTLTDAMVHSVNCAYARLALMAGLHNIADVAHRMGITSQLQEVPSMTLGTNVVTPLQMASAYATLAAGGVYHTPHLIREVDGPDGKPLFREKDDGKQVIPAQVAGEAVDVMRQVVQRGTGVAANVPGHDIAGKTGTADDYHDAWFVGFAPELATAVWMGDPDGEIPMRGVQGINVQGGSFPARIWADFMGRVLPGGSTATLPTADPALVPPGVFLRDGQPRIGGAPGDTTYTTPWCMASCPGAGGGAPAPKAPKPPGDGGHQKK